MRISLKEKLRNKELTIGSWIQIGHPAVAEIMASLGFDWLCVDLEHGHIDIESLTNILRTLKAFNITSLVRVPKNEEVWIRRSLDAGADGLIIPMVNSEEEARSAVRISKFPPDGIRGFGYCRANGYGENFNSYVERINREVVIVAQIEHFSAIDNLNGILNVDGIDAVFIGPLDLSGSYGHTSKLDSPEMRKAFEQYLSLCEKKGIPAGLHIVLPDHTSISKAIESGYTFLALGLDVTFLKYGAQNQLDSILRIKDNITA